MQDEHLIAPLWGLIKLLEMYMGCDERMAATSLVFLESHNVLIDKMESYRLP